MPKDSLFAGDAEYLQGLRKRERRNPFGELSLFVNLEHAYHHLNMAWNSRKDKTIVVTSKSKRTNYVCLLLEVTPPEVLNITDPVLFTWR